MRRIRSAIACDLLSASVITTALCARPPRSHTWSPPVAMPALPHVATALTSSSEPACARQNSPWMARAPSARIPCCCCASCQPLRARWRLTPSTAAALSAAMLVAGSGGCAIGRCPAGGRQPGAPPWSGGGSCCRHCPASGSGTASRGSRRRARERPPTGSRVPACHREALIVRPDAARPRRTHRLSARPRRRLGAAEHAFVLWTAMPPIYVRNRPHKNGAK